MEEKNPRELVHLKIILNDLVKGTSHQGIRRLMDRIGRDSNWLDINVLF